MMKRVLSLIELFSLMGLAVLPACASVLHGLPGCAVTAEAAVRQAIEKTTTPQLAGTDGFRVVSFWDDPLRGSRWAVVESCSRQQTPKRVVQVAFSTPALRGTTPAAPLLVRAGDLVTVTFGGVASRMNLQGSAEGSAAAGGRVRVHLQSMFGEEQAAAKVLTGIVIKPGFVEVEQ